MILLILMILMILMILQVNDWRYWNQNEMLIHKTDLAKIPPAAVIFQEAEETMLAPGMVVSDTAASVPLASPSGTPSPGSPARRW